MTNTPITRENAYGYLKFKDATNKVTSKGPEGANINRITSGRTPELAQLYADFQNAEHPLAWLEDNKTKLTQYDVNYDAIFAAAAEKEAEKY